MRKKTKQCFSLLLAAAMVLSAGMPSTVKASEETPEKEKTEFLVTLTKEGKGEILFKDHKGTEKKFKEEETVELDIQAEKDSQLKELVILDKETKQEAASMKDTTNDHFTFKMPKRDLIVKATFVDKAATFSVKVKTGWQEIDGKNYFFEEDGTPHKGWLNYKNKTYYTNEKGEILTGSQYIKEGEKKAGYYYFDPENKGAFTAGWVENQYYDPADEGRLVTAKGWKLIDDIYYFFENSKTKTGWYLDEWNDYYYLDPDTNGAMVTGYKEVGTEAYFFADSGKLTDGVGINHTLTVYDNRFQFEDLRTGYFEIENGQTCFCLMHEVDPPTVGTSLSTIGSYTYANQKNELLRKVFYYGYDGPAQISGATPNETILACSVANGHSDNRTHMGQRFIDEIANLPAAPDGFVVYVLTDNSSSSQDIAYWKYNDVPATGRMNLVKKSANPSLTNGSNCYSFEGAKFGVYTDGACTHQVGTLTTDKEGNSNSLELNAGGYYVKELEAPKGYYKNEAVEWVQVNAGHSAQVTFEDEPMNDPMGIKIFKMDKDTGSETPLGAATLEGAKFEVKFYNDYYEKESLKDIKPTRSWVIQTKQKTLDDGHLIFQTGLDDYYKVSGDEFYYDGINKNPVLPLGTLTIEEIEAPNGYLLDGAKWKSVTTGEEFDGMFCSQIKTDRDGAVLQGGHEFEAQDQVIRGDFEFTKKDSKTQKAMADIPFKITSTTTKESHIIMTDENGYFSTASEYAPHSHNTNGGKAGDGTWFGQNEDGTISNVNDEVGALPFDTYTIEEIKCENNKNKIMFEGTLVVSRHGFNIDMGTIENHSEEVPNISTTAKDETSNSHYAQAEDDVTIIDTVEYDKLKAGESYLLKGILMDKTSGSAIIGKDGKPVTSEKKFKPKMETGSVEVEFNFDATGLNGHDIVVFEELYKSSDYIAEHKDLKDEGQTIHFPEIGTKALDEDTKDHISHADDKITIIDTVSYDNLRPGKKYKVKGILMDKETEKPL